MRIRNGPKQTISTSGELGLLQMVSVTNIEQCASEEVGPQGRWIVRSYIDWGGGNEVLVTDIGRCANEETGTQRGGL